LSTIEQEALNRAKEELSESEYYLAKILPPLRLPDHQPKSGRFSINCRPYRWGDKRLAKLTIRKR